jgi:hypothetical protein
MELRYTRKEKTSFYRFIITVINVSIVNINGLIDEGSVTIKTGYCTTFSKSFEDTMQYSLT